MRTNWSKPALKMVFRNASRHLSENLDALILCVRIP